MKALKAAAGAAVLACAAVVPLVITLPMATAQDGVVVDSGHVDAVAPGIVGGQLQVRYKDGSQPGEPVWREPGTVVTHVKPESWFQVPEDPNYAFLGKPGDDVWYIPQDQVEGVVWAGWNTESLTASQVDPNSVRWTLDAISGDERGSAPPGAMTIFQNGSFGEPLPRVFDTNLPLPQSYGMVLGTHAHANWTFNAEGVYRLKFTVTATSADGTPLSDTETYTFAIGEIDPATVKPGEGAAPPSSSAPSSAPPSSAPPSSSDTTPSQPADDCVVLDDGHVDAIAPRVLDGQLTTQVKDGTAGPDQVVWRDPGEVVLHAVPAAKNTIPSNNPGYAFLGPAGSPVWLIPQTQIPGIVWAGWNTEELGPATVSGDVTLSLSEVDGPGNVAVFLTGLSPTVLFNAVDGLPDNLQVPLGTHAHANWGFTAEGVYRLTFTVTATLASGGQQSDTDTYTFAVGDVDAAGALGGQCAGGSGGGTATSAQPGPAPIGSGPTPAPQGGAQSLAYTGAGGLGFLVPTGVLLIVTGAALLVLFRRSKNQA
ncbi:choice-of-anchor M domain-containing protein [Amycolatopsis lurida]